MNIFSKTKEKIKTIGFIFSNLAPYHFDCPNCALSTDARFYDCMEGTASIKYVRNELYHKPSFYVKCNACGFTTPAYDTSKEALDVWSDDWVTTELKIANKLM